MKTWLSLLAGLLVTAGLFAGIWVMDAQRARTPPMPADVARAVFLPTEPPPPPTPTTHAASTPIVPLGIEATSEPSPVKITLPPPEIAPLLPDTPPHPPAVAQMGDLLGDYRPSAESLSDERYIYQVRDVDQPPRVIDRVLPQVPSYVRGGADSMRMTLTVVIDPHGEPIHPRLLVSSKNRRFDDIMMRNIQEWTFSPAIKKGKPVRCLVEEEFIVMWKGGSMFSL